MVYFKRAEFWHRTPSTKHHSKGEEFSAGLASRRAGSQAWETMDIKEVWASPGPELARPATLR